MLRRDGEEPLLRLPSAAGAAGPARAAVAAHRPQDRYGLVWAVFVLQGVGMNFPWNVFITAVLYFQVRLADTPFKDNFENIFSLCYSAANLCFMVLVVLHAHRPCFTMRLSVVTPQVLTAVIFAVTTAMVKIQVSGGLFFAITCAFVLGSGVAAALVQAGIFGLAGRFPPIYTQAVMSGQGVAGIIVSVTSLFSALSSSCGAGQSGSGSGGGGGIPSKEAVFPEAFYFFLTSTIVVVITLASFLSMNGSDFAQHYAFSMGEAASELEHDNDMDDPVTLIDAALDQGDADPATTPLSNGSSTGGSGRLILRNRSHRQSILNSPVFQKSPRTIGSSGSARSVGSAGSHSAQTSLSSIGEQLGSVEEGIVVGDVAEEFANVVASPSTSVAVRRAGAELSGALLVADAPHESKPIPTCELISMIGRHCFSVCFVFIVTLSVFPAITSEIRSKSNLSNERCPKAGRFPFGAGVWQALFFLIFNVGDTVGRLLAGLGRPFAAKHVVWISLARVGFIPLFLLCTLASKTSGGKGPSPETLYDGGDTGGVLPSLGFFHEDYWPVLFMAIMAISNGWVASLEMMAGPSLVPDGQQSRAGTIMAFFLVLGLVLGSVLSFGVRALACNCNPFLPEQ